MGKSLSVRVKKLSPSAKVGIAYADDAGIDLFAIRDVTLPPGKVVKVPTGVIIEIPKGHVGIIKERSSMALKNLDVKAGVIDAGYRGEVIVVMRNLGNEPYEIKAGDKIAQIVILPVPQIEIVYVTNITETERNEKGFGSSDAK